jgi:hypothetical protein
VAALSLARHAPGSILIKIYGKNVRRATPTTHTWRERENNKHIPNHNPQSNYNDFCSMHTVTENI